MYPKLKNRAWRVLKSENILRLGPWLSVRQECVELPSGKQIPTWFVLEFPDWINVIAITKDGKMVMEDQYRHALGETHYELVAGVIDPGETPLEAAKRELSEETGILRTTTTSPIRFWREVWRKCENNIKSRRKIFMSISSSRLKC